MNIENLILKLQELPLKFIFEIEYRYYKTIVNKMTTNLFSFPILLFLEFEKESIYAKYLKGKSIKKQILFQVNNMQRKLSRKPSEEVIERYYRFSMYIQAKEEYELERKEINSFVASFPEYKPNPDLFDNVETIN